MNINTYMYFFKACLWASEKNITDTVFNNSSEAKGSCSRAQAITYLWRAFGSPRPVLKTSRFADVGIDAYYYDAVLWAAESGITFGMHSGVFRPNSRCTRAQMITFLWRALGYPEEKVKHIRFSDVFYGEYYTDAVLWAEECGITNGISKKHFGPDMTCSHAQALTFLYRALK